jgi:hypothetical protein
MDNAGNETQKAGRPGPSRVPAALVVAVVLAILLDLALTRHSHFGIDGTFGFAAWYGLLACVVIVACAKAIGSVLKRPDTTYDC